MNHDYISLLYDSLISSLYYSHPSCHCNPSPRLVRMETMETSTTLYARLLTPRCGQLHVGFASSRMTRSRGEVF